MKLLQSNLSDSSLSWDIIREAMAYPFSPKINEELAENKVFTAPNIGEKYPKGGSTEYEKILEETGAEKLFGTKEPKIRKFFLPSVKNLVIINEQEYILAHIKEPKKGRGKEKVGSAPGVITVYGPVAREQDGEINWKETGKRLTELPYEGNIEQIKRSPNAIKEEKDYINKFITKYNEFVDKKTSQKGGGNITVLPLQLKWAEDMINERLATLEVQIKSMENSDRDSKKDVGNEAYRGLMEDSKGGKITDMSPHDYILMLLEKKYHSLPSLNELKAEIIGEKMPFDEQTNTILKNFVNRIIDWQIAERQKDEAKKQKEKNERQERIEDIESVKELTLEKINVIDDLPGKYQKATEYFSPETMITQMHEATTGISQDYNELKAIRDALTGARQVIIELPSKKSKDISEVAMRQIQELLNQSKVFIKRYKVDPFVKTEKGTEINPKLFGSRGTLGNGLISVVLRHIITSVEEELNRINEVRPLVETQPEKTPVAPTSPLPQPVAYTKSQINKISEGLWGFFTNRMRLK